HLLLRPDKRRRGAAEFIHHTEKSAGDGAAYPFGQDGSCATIAPQAGFGQQSVVALEIARKREGRWLYTCFTQRSQARFEFRFRHSRNGVAISPDEMRKPTVQADLLRDGCIRELADERAAIPQGRRH